MSKNKICVYLLVMLFAFIVPAQAAYLAVDDLTANHSIGTALTLKNFVDSDDVNAGNVNEFETAYSHASIQAVTGVSGYHDWYAFSVSIAQTKVFFDIDFTEGDLWSYIKLYDSEGNEVVDAFNSVGEMFDPGSQFPWDSFLSLTLDSAGTYYLSVGNGNNQGLASGQNYVLHVGLANAGQQFGRQPGIDTVATPIPAGIWLFGSALLALSGNLKNRRKSEL